MKEKIVHSPVGITVLGGGKVKAAQITLAMQLAPCLVAADGGARKALEFGLTPKAIIGDMDSLGEAGEHLPSERVFRLEEQDSTDFEKCLYSIEAPFVLALGVTGSRFDHSLAALNALGRTGKIPAIIVSGKDLVFLSPRRISLNLPVGTRLSLFPLIEVKATSQGLHWPLEGDVFSPLGRIGTSNRTIDKTVRLEFDKPGMLIVLPWRHLPGVLEDLRRVFQAIRS